MLKNSFFRRTAVILLLAVLCVTALTFSACNKPAADPGKNPVDDPDIVTPEPPPDDTKYVDVFIFMGQSNMAGRGNAPEALPCSEEAAREFRAVSGSDDKGWLYPVAEPFGNTEDNAALNDKGMKKGGVVSSFCEAYYATTEVPVIAVSASVGNTSITSWTPGTAYFNEAKRRLNACLTYMEGQEETVRRVNMLWCQGENDAVAFAAGNFDYNAKLKSIVNGLKDLQGGKSVDTCFVIPPSEFSKNAANPQKTLLANEQIKLCENDDDFVLATLKFRGVPLSMRDDPHFRQGVYNVAGYNAGLNVGSFLDRTGAEPDYSAFTPGEEKTLAAAYGVTLQYHT